LAKCGFVISCHQNRQTLKQEKQVPQAKASVSFTAVEEIPIWAKSAPDEYK
jgi:hypothetical protein